ncbi:MAG: aminodeoxychorismate/anthranilate synthase component II [Pseudomonadota bacterium]
MILVIDNYDSFVETLARYAREAATDKATERATGKGGGETHIVRNDSISVDEALRCEPTAIILSPGPGRPSSAGICVDLIKAAPSTPILGVCLGHQALAEAYGGETIPSPEPMHGRASPICHSGDDVFAGIPSPFMAGRYHSLLGSAAPQGELLEVAWTESTNLPMAFRHRNNPHWGVQFHPESLLTVHGRLLLENFLQEAL